MISGQWPVEEGAYLNNPVRSYQDLMAWQKAMDLVTEVYKITHEFPREEIFGLTSQLRRAAVSVPSNITEGQGRSSRKEFLYFLGNAKGSLSEVETKVLIARNLGYIDKEGINDLLNHAAEVGRILNGLMASLRNKK
ncbi:MAG: four helix bundle protein [Thermodesulfobacteriota bacterium]